MRTALRLVFMVSVMAGCGVGGYYWFEEYKTPTVREHVAAPLYTVGSTRSAEALRLGKEVIEFGPLPASAFYAGGLAFRQPEEARAWIREAGLEAHGWTVYLLSGDYDLDTHTVRGLPHTNKTLLVRCEVNGDIAQRH